MDASTNYYLLLGIFDPDDDLSGTSDADPEVMESIRHAISDKQLESGRASRNPRKAIQLEGKRRLDLLQHAETALDTQAKRERQFDEALAIVDTAMAKHVGNFASKGFIAAPEIGLIVDRIADETGYAPTPITVRSFARRKHIDIRRTAAPSDALKPIEPPKPDSFHDYEAIRPHLDVCGVDDLYTFLGGSPQTCWYKSAFELRGDARERFEAMPRKHDTLTEARTKLFRCCIDRTFASERSKSDYDAYLQYLMMMRVLEDAGEACAYTKTMESANQAPHFIRMLRDASGTAGTLVSAATAAGYLLWYCRAHDIACTPSQWWIDGNEPKPASASADDAPKVAETPRPWPKPNTPRRRTPKSNAPQPSGWRPATTSAPKKPEPAAPKPFILTTNSGERIAIAGADQLVEVLGTHTDEASKLLYAPDSRTHLLDPTLSVWLRALPDGERLISQLLREDTAAARYIVLHTALVPSKPVVYHGIVIDDRHLRNLTDTCLRETRRGGRGEANREWRRTNSLLNSLLSGPFLPTYANMGIDMPSFDDDTLNRLVRYRRQILEVMRDMQGTRYHKATGNAVADGIENLFGAVYQIDDLESRILHDAHAAASRLVAANERLSERCGYVTDADMAALVRLAVSIPDPDDAGDDTSSLGRAFAAKSPLEAGVKELDDAERLYAQRSRTSSPSADTAYTYTTYRIAMFCPKCGAEINQDAKFCGTCGAPIRPSGARAGD